MDSDEISLINNENISEIYSGQIIQDTENIKNNLLHVKIEFSDHLCIYKKINNKLLYEFSYYNILSWLHGKNQFGINYKKYGEDKNKIMFKVDNSLELVNSIKDRVNELLDYVNNGEDKL